MLGESPLVGVQPAALTGVTQEGDQVGLLLFVGAVEIKQRAERPGSRPYVGMLDAVERRHVDAVRSPPHLASAPTMSAVSAAQLPDAEAGQSGVWRLPAIRAPLSDARHFFASLHNHVGHRQFLALARVARNPACR